MNNQNAPQTGQVFTGAGIDYYRLTTLKHALKLESKGLKSRGGALRPQWHAQLGLRSRDSYLVFVNRIIDLQNEYLKANGTPAEKLIPHLESL